jgi:shikimate dehydrogenase
MSDLFGLIGQPLEHSFSAVFFNEKFKNEGINASYRNFELKKIIDILSLLQENKRLKGLNVTSPYKQEIIPLLSQIDVSAQEIKATNTIKVCNDTLIGYNTDTFGFKTLWENNISDKINSVLILGSGGASKAIQHILKEKQINFYVSSRKIPTENQPSETDFQVIINATPLGMFPKNEEIPPVNTTKITKNHIVIDLIYNPKRTVFLRISEAKGAKVINGYEMFVAQALKSWEIWQSNR